MNISNKIQKYFWALFLTFCGGFYLKSAPGDKDKIPSEASKNLRLKIKSATQETKTKLAELRSRSSMIPHSISEGFEDRLVEEIFDHPYSASVQTDSDQVSVSVSIQTGPVVIGMANSNQVVLIVPNAAIPLVQYSRLERLKSFVIQNKIKVTISVILIGTNIYFYFSGYSGLWSERADFVSMLYWLWPA